MSGTQSESLIIAKLFLVTFTFTEEHPSVECGLDQGVEGNYMNHAEKLLRFTSTVITNS